MLTPSKKVGINAGNLTAFERFVLDLLPPDERENGLIGVFLTGYFDESGTHHNSPVVVVAGYLATAPQWRDFESRWREMLDHSGVKVFHRVALENFAGEFTGWTEERRRAFIQEAARIIQDHTEVGISAAVMVKDYELTMDNPMQLMFESPYGFCAQIAVCECLCWAASNGHKEPVNFIFEAGAKGRAALDDAMDGAAVLPREKLSVSFAPVGGWGFHRKDALAQLHAADFLAYESYKHLANGHASTQIKPIRPVRKSFELLAREVDVLGVMKGEQLRRWLEWAERQGLVEAAHVAWVFEEMRR